MGADHWSIIYSITCVLVFAFRADIYTKIVAPFIVKSDLVVESWRNGAGGIADKSCAYYSVTDVKTVRIVFKSGWYTEFNYTEDHSKWAVAVPKPYFCFSSLNRMVSKLTPQKLFYTSQKFEFAQHQYDLPRRRPVDLQIFLKTLKRRTKRKRQFCVTPFWVFLMS